MIRERENDVGANQDHGVIVFEPARRRLGQDPKGRVGRVGPKQVRNQLGATRRLLNFFSPGFGAGKPVCGEISFRGIVYPA